MIRNMFFVLVLGFGVGAQAEAIKGMAKSVGGMAVTAGVMNTGFGKAMMDKCAASQPAGQMFCFMAMAGFSQAVVDAALAKDAKKTENQVSSGMEDFNGGNYNSDIPGGDINSEQVEAFLTDANEGLKNLEKLGFKKNRNGTVSGPNGKTASAASLNSGKALADAGLIDEQDIENYDAALAAHKKKKDKIIVKSLGGAKGGYSSRRKRSTASVGDYDYSYGSGLDKSKIRAAQTSGLTKNFGGTPIGVASDDLFNMVSERYNSISEKRQFIDNAAGTYSGQ